MTHGRLARKEVAGSPGLRGVIFIAIGALATSRFVLVVLESLRSLLAVRVETEDSQRSSIIPSKTRALILQHAAA